MNEEAGMKRLLVTNINVIRKLWTPSHGVVVHKQKFDILSFVGRVTGITDQSTKCVYYVDDGTEGIDVLMWKGGDDGKAATLESTISEGTYVRVNGQVRTQGSNINIVAFKVTPIKDFNEVTAHYLEVVQNNLLLRKLKILHLATRGEPTANGRIAGSANNGSTPMEVGDIGANVPSGMNRAQTMILEALNKCKREEGLSKEEIAQCCPNLDPNTLQGSLDFLANEGHVFATVDENHYKSAYDS